MSRVEPVAGRSAFDGYHCGCRSIGESPRSQQRTEFELRLTEAGSTTYLFGGREAVLPARRLAMFWTGTPHQVLRHEAGDVWSLRLPLGWVLSRGLPAPFVNGLLEGRIFFEPDIDHFECDLYRFRLWSDGGVRRHPMLLRAVELEVEARLVRLAAALPPMLPPMDHLRATAEGRPRKVLEVATLTARHHAERLSMSDLGKAAGRHPNYVMNLFRREYGTSLLEYLTQHRLAHALRLLVTSDVPLAEAARRSGFGSVKRFRLTFRAAFKETPVVFRRSLRYAGVTGGKRKQGRSC